MGLIIPKTYAHIDKPLIFLAGPIRGAPNWQDEAAIYILEKDPDLIVASPRRDVREGISKYIINGNNNYFPRQRAWELYHLDIASRTGAIMFWLPGEVEHHCSKSYGAMTRVELGEWMIQYKYDNNVRLCIGSDNRFSELDTILYDLNVFAPDKKIQNTLKETCDEALRITRNQKH